MTQTAKTKPHPVRIGERWIWISDRGSGNYEIIEVIDITEDGWTAKVVEGIDVGDRFEIRNDDDCDYRPLILKPPMRIE